MKSTAKAPDLDCYKVNTNPKSQSTPDLPQMGLSLAGWAIQVPFHHDMTIELKLSHPNVLSQKVIC